MHVVVDVNFPNGSEFNGNGGDGDGISSVAASHEIHSYSSIIMLKFKMYTYALLSEGLWDCENPFRWDIRFARQHGLSIGTCEINVNNDGMKTQESLLCH